MRQACILQVSVPADTEAPGGTRGAARAVPLESLAATARAVEAYLRSFDPCTLLFLDCASALSLDLFEVSLPSLQHLSMDLPNAPSSLFRNLRSLRHLELSIRDWPTTERELQPSFWESLREAAGLESLKLDGVPHLPPFCETVLTAADFPMLVRVVIRGCSRLLAAADSWRFLGGVPNLSELDVSLCAVTARAAVPALLAGAHGHLRALTRFSLTDATVQEREPMPAEEALIAPLLRGCPALRVLRLCAVDFDEDGACLEALPCPELLLELRVSSVRTCEGVVNMARRIARFSSLRQLAVLGRFREFARAEDMAPILAPLSVACRLLRTVTIPQRVTVAHATHRIVVDDSGAGPSIAWSRPNKYGAAWSRVSDLPQAVSPNSW
mmetsp:Transcript_33548/g.103562  ORF Transcript_33548/g.103562 Transcript_33548/m.103562 type:complete len:384 (-) Transcript_33548:31-1182(-)